MVETLEAVIRMLHTSCLEKPGSSDSMTSEEQPAVDKKD
jgi:hypothetical protein